MTMLEKDVKFTTHCKEIGTEAASGKGMERNNSNKTIASH